MKSGTWLAAKVLLVAAVLAFVPGWGAQATMTTATNSGNWSVAGNWDNGLPADGYDVVIAAGKTITNNAATPNLSSFTNNGTLLVQGWTSTLTATSVYVSATGFITADGPSPLAGPTNRVWIVATNVTVAASGQIDVTGKGYNGLASSAGVGPGGGAANATSPGAGGYGGRGGTGIGSAGGGTYGSSSAPETLGSSGASWSGHPGGHAGGAIRIDSPSRVTVNGAIRANGLGGSSGYGGGGSGGSIWINCGSIVGNGLIQSAGGTTAAPGNYDDAGCGGGGRIAIVYDPIQQAAEPVKPTITFAGDGGLSPHNRELIYFWPAAVFSTSHGESGTLYLTDTNFFPNATVFTNGFQLVVPSFTNWSPSSLTISNAWVEFGSGFQLNVGNDLTVIGAAGRLDYTNSPLRCGGSLILTNGGTLFAWPSVPGTYVDIGVGKDLILSGFASGFDVTLGSSLLVFSAATNGVSPTYGGLVAVTGSVSVASNCWIYPVSHVVNGGSTRFAVSNLTVALGGGINADGKGFRGDSAGTSGYGPGGSANVNNAPSGAGYGGRGGTSGSGAAPGIPYGSANAPTLPGSGGGGYGGNLPGSDGGGSVWIEAASNVTVNGLITANAISQNQYAGGGSGGGIYITCQSFGGSGRIRADGSDGLIASTYNDNGGGGGGRIAVLYNSASQAAAPTPTVDFSAAGGISRQNLAFAVYNGPLMMTSRGEPGTLYFTDTNFFLNSTFITRSYQLVIPGFTNWNASSLMVSNCWVELNGVQVNATGDVRVAERFGRLDVSNASVNCSGNLILTNCGALHLWATTNAVNALNCGGNVMIYAGGTGMAIAVTSAVLTVHAAPTNGISPDYGALATVVGDIVVSSNGWIYSYSNPTNGGAPLFSARNVMVAAGGGFDAVGRGYLAGTSSGVAGKGPSAGGVSGAWGGGGGYGGVGSAGFSGGAGGSVTYGSSNAPVSSGSGGGGQVSGAGGGVVRLQTTATLTLNGTISADGQGATYTGGGGAGGSVYIRCKTLTGAGQVTARGGMGGNTYNATQTGGAGGGGRIAVWRVYDTWAGTPIAYPASATNGVSTQAGAQPGTVALLQLPIPRGTIMLVR